MSVGVRFGLKIAHAFIVRNEMATYGAFVTGPALCVCVCVEAGYGEGRDGMQLKRLTVYPSPPCFLSATPSLTFLPPCSPSPSPCSTMYSFVSLHYHTKPSKIQRTLNPYLTAFLRLFGERLTVQLLINCMKGLSIL